MESADQMTNDELLYRMLKENASLYRGLAFVWGALVVACIIMGIAAIALGKGFGPVLYLTGAGVGFAITALSSWSQHKDFKAAVEEVGDDPTGLDTCRTYSAKTATAIARTRKDSKTLRQLWIAYGLLALTLLGFGCFFFYALFFMGIDDAEILFPACGSGLMIGGAIFIVLTVNAFVDWRAAKRLGL